MRKIINTERASIIKTIHLGTEYLLKKSSDFLLTYRIHFGYFAAIGLNGLLSSVLARSLDKRQKLKDKSVQLNFRLACIGL